MSEPGTRRTWRPMAMLTTSLLVLVAACGSSDDSSGGEDSTDSTTTTVAESTTTVAAGYELPTTPVMATLDMESPNGGLFPAGSVTANWYYSGENYVVVYTGLDLAALGAFCPGNSVEGAAGFSDVSNGAIGEGGCEGATTPEPPQPPRACGDLVVYVTAIPTSATGTLYGTVERMEGDGFVGATSTVATDLDATPEIDPDADAYTVDGETHTC